MLRPAVLALAAFLLAAPALAPEPREGGRRFRVLCVIDNFSREYLATVVDTSLSGQRVARVSAERPSS